MNSKIMMVSSAGGHLSEALIATEFLNKNDIVFVSYFLPHLHHLNLKMVLITNPHTSIVGYIKNFFESIKVYFDYRPKIVISTGAGVSIFLFVIARIMGAKTIYIESGCRITFPSRTGKILYPFANTFIIQSLELKKYFPKATYVKPIL